MLRIRVIGIERHEQPQRSTPDADSNRMTTEGEIQQASARGLLLARYWLTALAGTVVVALALGIPTDIVPNPWFTRMTPIETDQFVFWILTSVLTGALIGTYVLSRSLARHMPSQAIGSGLLGVLAVGCPVCNKLVVLLLGVSGAFQYFAPIQPYLGAASVVLAATALAVRLRAWRRACAVPAQSIP